MTTFQTMMLLFESCWVVVMLPLWAWVNISISRTHEERMKVIVAGSLRPFSGAQLLLAFRAVSFKAHMEARLMRRDAWALYDPIVREAVDNPRTEVITMEMAPGEPSDTPPAVH